MQLKKSVTGSDGQVDGAGAKSVIASQPRAVGTYWTRARRRLPANPGPPYRASPAPRGDEEAS